MKKRISKRPDGRGHWPKGKHRNEPHAPAGWTSYGHFMRDLKRFLAKHKQPWGYPNPNSAKRLAKDAGLSDGGVRNAIAGRYIPAPWIVDKIAAWLRERMADTK